MNLAETDDDDEDPPHKVKYAFILQEEDYEDEPESYDSDLQDNFGPEENLIQTWDAFEGHLNFFHIQY